MLNEIPESSINRRIDKLKTLLFQFVCTDVAAFQDFFTTFTQDHSENKIWYRHWNKKTSFHFFCKFQCKGSVVHRIRCYRIVNTGPVCI